MDRRDRVLLRGGVVVPLNEPFHDETNEVRILETSFRGSRDGGDATVHVRRDGISTFQIVKERRDAIDSIEKRVVVDGTEQKRVRELFDGLVERRVGTSYFMNHVIVHDSYASFESDARFVVLAQNTKRVTHVRQTRVRRHVRVELSFHRSSCEETFTKKKNARMNVVKKAMDKIRPENGIRLEGMSSVENRVRSGEYGDDPDSAVSVVVRVLTGVVENDERDAYEREYAKRLRTTFEKEIVRVRDRVERRKRERSEIETRKRKRVEYDTSMTELKGDVARLWNDVRYLAAKHKSHETSFRVFTEGFRGSRTSPMR